LVGLTGGLPAIAQQVIGARLACLDIFCEEMAPLLVFDLDNPQVAVALARPFDIGIDACLVRANALGG